MNKAISELKKLYLDSNILIYFLESNANYQERVERIILEAQAHNIELCISEFTICECRMGAYKRDDAKLIQIYEDFFSKNLASFEIVPSDSEILWSAPKLAGQLGLKLIDSIHFASAVAAHCDGFLTNDKAFASLEGVIEVFQLSSMSE